MEIKHALHEFKTQEHTFDGSLEPGDYDEADYKKVFLSNEAHDYINLILTALLDKEESKLNKANDAAISKDYPSTDMY